MAIEEIPVNLINEIGQMALWLQGIGVVIILWILFQLWIVYLNRKKMKEIYTIKDDMKRIESKIDKLVRKR